MRNNKSLLKKVIAVLCVVLMLTATLAACAPKKETSGGTGGSTDTTGSSSSSQTTTGGSQQQVNEPKKEQAYKLSIMAPYASDEHDKNPHRQEIYRRIREYTNTDVEFIFYPQTLYYDKVPLVLATADMPSIMVVGKDLAAGPGENGDIWEVGPYLDKFPNLTTIPEAVRQNASHNGRLYGIPRSRALGRNGVGYRLDWVENLGLPQPKTIDDFYGMLVAFTKNDPDRNGKNDTIGMAVTQYNGPWDQMQIWFGAPNGWKEENGKLIPAHMTKEWDDALKFFRKIYSEGLVNQDFDTYDPARWDELLRGGIAGCAVDVVDRFARNQEYFEREGIPAKTMIVGGFEGPYGLRILPTAGFSDLLIISKDKVKTEDELMKALNFLDKLNDAEMRNLIEWGVQGIDWDYGEDGEPIRYTVEEKPEIGTPNPREGLNQIIPYWSREEEAAKLITATQNEIRTLMSKVQTENEKYTVPNPGASFQPPTMTQIGTDLNNIIIDARTQYIKGIIDDVGLQAAKNQWLKSGGQQVIDEINELYQASKK